MKYADELEDTKFIATGLFTDKITGGIPRGKILVISGKWSTGKSTLIMQAIASAQKQGLKCLIADVEFSLEKPYVDTLEIDKKKLGVIRTDTAEETLDELESEIGTGKWDLVVIDSIGGLTSRLEAEKTSGEKTIGVQASLVSRFVRKVIPVIAMNDTALVCLTHETTDIMTGAIVAAGGAKLFYHASQHIRLKAKMGVLLKSGENVVGKIITAELKKDKLGGRERAEADGQMLFGSGFNKQADAWEEAVQKGFAAKQGNTWFLGETKLGTISKVREWLKEEKNASHLQELIKVV